MARQRKSSTVSETSSLPEQHQELGSMYDYLAKVILLGPSGSGKSCLLHRFVKNEWRILSSQTIGVEFSSKIVKIGSGSTRKRIKLQLWDTAGTERFRSVSRSYYRGAAGAILVYDVASLTSFNALPTFLMDARALASPNLSLILAGNKVDLSENDQIDTPPASLGVSSQQSPHSLNTGGSTRSRSDSVMQDAKWTVTRSAEGREVASDVASRWASRSGVPVVMDVSALSGENVEEMFNRLARMILTKIELGEIDPDDPQSGIQYGDGGAWDGTSTISGNTADDGNTMRRRRRKPGAIRGLEEFGDVFRKPGARRWCC